MCPNPILKRKIKKKIQKILFYKLMVKKSKNTKRPKDDLFLVLQTFKQRKEENTIKQNVNKFKNL